MNFTKKIIAPVVAFGFMCVGATTVFGAEAKHPCVVASMASKPYSAWAEEKVKDNTLRIDLEKLEKKLSAEKSGEKDEKKIRAIERNIYNIHMTNSTEGLIKSEYNLSYFEQAQIKSKLATDHHKICNDRLKDWSVKRKAEIASGKGKD